MASPHIGTLQERSLHAAVKDWYARPGDRTETEVDGYVVDLVREGELIEIQTGGFAPLRRKLDELTRAHRVRLVHPIATEKWILRVEADGQTPIGRRRSPKRGRPEDVFEHLVSIPHLMERQHFTLQLLMIREEEVRRFDGNGGWRHPEWTRLDRRLIDVVAQRDLVAPDDCRAFLPASMPRPFTNRDLAAAADLRLSLAGKLTYCLRKMGVLEVVGKVGNSQLHAEPA
ncbi:MAG: hypothetical protein ABIL09_14570 [Gemmatimonadota bacterium]